MEPTEVMDEQATPAMDAEQPEEELWLEELTPRQIVAELDKYIVAQEDAKKAVAIALRNRWRRRHVPEDLRDEIVPNNIIMIGPTGVGKTEIARRLARLAGAPFVKVEASKFTEVGYVGRDVESMIRDLVDYAINMVRSEREVEVEELAQGRVEDRLLDLLIPPVGDGASKKTPAEGIAALRAFVAGPGGQVEDRRSSTSEAPADADADADPGRGRRRRCASGGTARARSSARCCARKSWRIVRSRSRCSSPWPWTT